MHDVVIVGAGPVGGALALALADADLDIVALDARAAGATLRGDRSLALSHGARLIFERLGVWPRLAAMAGAVTPIVEIDISQAGGFGVTRLIADEQGMPALGYVVSYRALAGGDRRGAGADRHRRPLRRRRRVGRRERRRDASIALSGAAAEPLLRAPRGRRRRHGYRGGRHRARTARLRAGRADRQGRHGSPASRRRLRTLHARRPDGAACPRASTTASVVDDDAGEGGGDAGAFRRPVPGRARAPFRHARHRIRASGRPPHVSAAARIRAAHRRARAASSSATPRRRCIRSPGRASTWACAMRSNWARRSFARRGTRWASEPMLSAFAAQRRTDRYAGIAFTHGLTQLFATDAAVGALAARLGAYAARRAAAREEGVHARDAVRHVLNARSLACRGVALRRLNKSWAMSRNGHAAKPV